LDFTKLIYNLAYSSDNSFSIDNLKDVSFNVLALLKKSGFFSMKDLIVLGPFEVSSQSGIDIDDSFMIYNQALAALEDIGLIEKRFIPATSLYYKRKNIGRISTGSKNFDNLLGGGIETKSITEVCGEYGTGKTQLCHTACVTVQQDYSKGGLKGNALYIDTENTFRPERIESISRLRNLGSLKTLDNIIVAKAYSSSHHELIISEVSKVIDSHNIKLMIIDSIISLYRSEFIGLHALSERQQRLNKLIHTVMRIAETFEIAVLLTNQVQSSPESTFNGNSFKAAGGNIMAHSSTYRIFLRRSGRNRIARMVDSPYHPESEIVFTIGDDGISDPQNYKDL
jgi:DNA repair protein RadA